MSIFLIIILLGAFLQQGYSQFTGINGPIVNEYTSIETIFSYDDNNVDTLEVGDLTGFGEGDTVMVYCVRGAGIKTSPGGDNGDGGDAQLPRNTGKYAILIIDQIIQPGDLVILNSSLPEISPLGEGEVAQLIRIPSYRRAEVAAELTAEDWDGSTGGVVALFVQRTLKISADINVTGRGFQGAEGSGDLPYDEDCASTDPDAFDSTFYKKTGTTLRAGLKGEGTTDTRFDLMRGKGKNINGGGGGNGRLSGGGGGSNWNFGGRGGRESSACEPPGIDTRGMGGFDLQRFYYKNNDPIVGNRIFLGGGGGTGTRVSGRVTADGGDGGGIVVIIADSIVGNGGSIIADGESVEDLVTGAGGGGGGGGVIVLDAGYYNSTLSMRAVGGDGGNTNHPSDTTGPGGGGGGGLYWYAGSSHPELDPELDEKAVSGLYQPAVAKHGATDGTVAGEMDNLRVPLRGFLFNTVPDKFTVCADELPGPIYASIPKGGSGSYTYQWIDSTASHSWQPAPGTSNQKDYTFPGPLSDTTWFRRVVTSPASGLPADTSFRIAFNVHPAITGNTVAAPDTVCSGNAPELFEPSAAMGGGLGPGTYTYKWQKDEGSGTFTDADGTITGASYQAPGLTTTTRFNRIAFSGVCEDTSAALRVQVWEPLTGNDITPFDTVCFNTAPEEITGPEPGQGDPDDKRYRWEVATDPEGTWSVIPGAESRTYQSLPLTETVYIHRVALSGSDDACVDTSNYLEILNIQPVTGNTVSVSGNNLVCRGDQAPLLTGSDPGGGYQGQYSYRWLARTEYTGWGQAQGDNDVKSNYDAGIMDGDTTFFRRVVGSGGVARNVCLDTSTSVAIHVLPPITNNVITTSDDMKCQGDLLENIVQDVSGGSTPGGGASRGGIDNTRRYRWEVATGQGVPGSWQELAGDTSINYEARPLLETEDDRWYRRIVFSGKDRQCKDTSNLQKIIVHKQITSNVIEFYDSVCFASTKLLEGATPEGEPGLTPTYLWRDADSGDPLPASDEEDHGSGPYNSLGSYHYERIVSIGQCTDTSNAMELTVMQLPGGRLTDAPFRACERDTVLFIDISTDRLNTYTLPWEVTLTDGVNPEPVGPYVISADGNLEISMETEADSTQFNYQIASISYASPQGRYLCEAPPDSLSGAVPIEVFRVPEPVITPSDSAKVCDITINLSANPDNGTGHWSQVNTDKPLLTFSDPDSEQTALFIQDSSERYGKYRIRYRSVAGDCYADDFIDVSFFEQPEPAYAGEDTMIFFISTIQLHADPPTAGIGTWTMESGSGSIEDIHDPETNVYELALGQENTFRWTVENGEDEGKCVTYDDRVIVIRNEVRRYSGFSPGNDDMENEYFIMQGLKYADRFTISFFNSLGKTVRTLTEKDIDQLEVDQSRIKNGLKEDEMVVWDGRSGNGNLVPAGTYYYVVDFYLDQHNPITGETRTTHYDFNGYVVVKRD